MRYRSFLAIALFLELVSCDLSLCSENLTFASRPYYGWAFHVQVTGQYAFVGAGSSLLVIDIHDPVNPALVSSIDFSSSVNPQHVKGDTLFVTTNSALYLIDISDPPSAYVTHIRSNSVSSLATRDSLLFLAAGDLVILNLKTLGDVIGRYDYPYKIDQLAVNDSIAIIGVDENYHEDGRLQMLDIRDISSPKLLWDEFGRIPRQIAIVDSLAFVLRFGHVEMYKISSDSLKLIDSTPFLNAGGFFIKEKMMYVYATNEVALYDFANSSDLERIGAFTSRGGAVRDVFVRNGYTYVANQTEGLQIFDTEDINRPKLIGQFDRTTNIVNLLVRKAALFTRTDFHFQPVFQVFDLREPLWPSLLSNTDLTWPAKDMFLKEDLAYFTKPSGIAIYDIANLRSPRLNSMISSSGNNEAVFVQNNLIFLASQGLRIFDLSSRQLVAQFSVPGTSTDGLFVMGDLVFLWGFSHMFILDISNLPQLDLMNDFDLSGAYNVAISPDTIAFVAQGFRGLDIIDMSQPDDVITLAQYSDGDEVNDLALHGNLAFLAGDNSCRVLDVTNPSQPVRIAHYATTIAASQIAYLESRGLVYLNGYGLGLLILNFEQGTVDVNTPENSVASKFHLFQNYPNPFNPITTIRFTLPRTEYVNLRVFNLSGAEVAVLVNEKKIAGEHEIEWNASNLSSGVYIYQLRANNYVESNKLILLK